MQNISDEVIVKTIKEVLPSATAVYLYGSQVYGNTHTSSDWDIGLLDRSPISGEDGFILKSRLANALASDIDIVDMRTADTVSNVQILESGRLIFVSDRSLLDRFELVALAKYTQLNLERRDILNDIEKSGRVRG